MTVTAFQPTDRQLAVLKRFQDADYDIPVLAACNGDECERVTYYRWFENAEFAAWWQVEHDTHFRRKLPRVTANLHRGATGEYGKGDPKPDASLIKLFLERFDADYMPKSRSELTGKDGSPLGPQVVTFLLSDGGDAPEPAIDVEAEPALLEAQEQIQPGQLQQAMPDLETVSSALNGPISEKPALPVAPGLTISGAADSQDGQNPRAVATTTTVRAAPASLPTSTYSDDVATIAAESPQHGEIGPGEVPEP